MKKTYFMILILIITMLFSTACQKSPVKTTTTSKAKSSSSKSSQQKTSLSSTSITSSKTSSITSSTSSKISSSKISSSKISSSKISSSKISTSSLSSTISQSATTSQQTGPKPIVFDDPVLESILRKIAKKPTGNVFPADLSIMSSFNEGTAVHYSYELEKNLSKININNYQESVTGKFQKFTAISEIPIKNLFFSYIIENESNTTTTYNLDLKSFTDSGTLESCRIYGTRGTAFENKHYQIFQFNNFNNISKCTNFKYLELIDCKGFDLSGQINLQNIETVSLKNCSITSIEALRNSPKLFKLELEHNSNLILDKTILLSLPNLFELTLKDLPKLDADTKSQLIENGVTIYES